MSLAAAVQQVIYETPWTWAHNSFSFLTGHTDGVYLKSGLSLPKKWQVAVLIGKAFSNTLITQGPLFKKHIYWERPLHYLGLALVANCVATACITDGHIEEWKCRGRTRQVLFKIWQYTPKFLAISSIYYALLGMRDRPIPLIVQLLAAGASLVMPPDNPQEKQLSVSLVWHHVCPAFASGFIAYQGSLMARVGYSARAFAHLHQIFLRFKTM